MHIDAAEFDNYLAENRYVFANFYAPWCIWCQRLEPVWEAFAESVLANDNRQAVKVVKIDCVKNHAFCIAHKVQAFPTLRFYTDGESHMSQYQSDRTVVSFEAFVDEQLDKDHYVKSIKDPTKRAIAHNERIVEAKVASVLQSFRHSDVPSFDLRLQPPLDVVLAPILTPTSSSSSY